MIAFLPVARYRVDYQVASGRPFSSFERLLLIAIHQGNSTLDSLTDVFKLHRRMVIEGIVTLMQAGWVCLGTDGASFVTTASGRKAAEGSGELPPTIVVGNKSTTLLFEKVSGQLARSSDLDLYNKQRLEKLWTFGVSVPPSDIPNIIEPGMVAQLLPHESGEWVRLVGPINVVTDNRLYAVVDVDPVARTLTGVPSAWRALLTDEIVNHVLRAEARLAKVVGSDEENELKQLASTGGWVPDASTQTSWEPVPISVMDMITTPEEHAATLKGLLLGAQSSVTIVTSGLSEAVVGDTIHDLQSALDRDLLISVLWCTVAKEASQDHARGLELLKKLEYDSNHGKYFGRLVVNTVPLGGSVNLLISDAKNGIEVIFGSFAWLRSPSSGQEKHFSIKLNRSAIGARLCDFVADLTTKDERIRVSSAMTTLRKLAAMLRSTNPVSFGSDTPGTASVESNVLFDEAVKWYVDETIEHATESIHLAVDHLPPARQATLVKQLSLAGEHIGHPIEAFISHPGDAPHSIWLEGTSESVQPGMRVNLVIADETSVIIGNHSWFADDVVRCRPYGSYVTLTLRGSRIGQLVLKRLGLWQSS
jgi:hypothetical protein